jgi:hypothetical protein
MPPACGRLSAAAACLRPLPVHDPAIGRRMIVGAGRPASEAAVLGLEHEITPGRVTTTRDRPEQNLKATSN